MIKRQVELGMAMPNDNAKDKEGKVVGIRQAAKKKEEK
jgi:hypothetical protein